MAIDEIGILHHLEKHIHSAAKCYPTLGDGLLVEGVAGAWTLGGFKEIVPANAITSDFDIHYVVVEGATASDIYEIVLYAGTTEIGRVRVAFLDVANSKTLPSIPIQTEVVKKNTQIQAKCANKAGGSEDITISLHYHTY